MRVHVSVIDRQELVRIAVHEILSRIADVHFVGDFTSIEELLASNAQADVLLLGDTVRDGLLDAIAHVAETCPQLRIIALGRRWTRTTVQTAIERGAIGIMDRDEHLRDLLSAAVQRVHRGERYLSPTVAALAFQQEMSSLLTPCELHIVRLMHDGATTKQLAAALDISTRTVYRHQAEIRRKLGVQTKQQIVHEAVQRGLL